MEGTRDVKLCLLGDTLVGKTSIVQRFVYDTFNETMDRTIGAAFFSKSVTVDSVAFRYQIWDTAGQEKYRALAPMYYRDASAAIVVFDITAPDSFMSVKTWITELRRLADPSVIIVVGNKLDLAEERRVDNAEAEAFAANNGCLYVETSAKDSVNVTQLFIVISQHLIANKASVRKESTVNVPAEHVDSTTAKKSPSCCGGRT